MLKAKEQNDETVVFNAVVKSIWNVSEIDFDLHFKDILMKRFFPFGLLRFLLLHKQTENTIRDNFPFSSVTTWVAAMTLSGQC